MRDPRLDRRVPGDFKHVAKYPFTAVAPPPVKAVERVLLLPSWHKTHDQGRQGSCVGHGTAMERAITNTSQNRLLHLLRPTVRYDPMQIWNEAKKVDEWPDTNPGDDNGTSVRAAYDVLRARGPIRVKSMRLVDGVPAPFGEAHSADPDSGVSVTRWATSVDEIRTAIANGLPVAIGVNWYAGFYGDKLELRGKEWWIPAHATASDSDGGHCVCLYGASDRRQAFRMKNSWGPEYPEVWLPYEVMSVLLAQDGEAALVTDR